MCFASPQPWRSRPRADGGLTVEPQEEVPAAAPFLLTFLTSFLRLPFSFLLSFYSLLEIFSVLCIKSHADILSSLVSNYSCTICIVLLYIYYILS